MPRSNRSRARILGIIGVAAFITITVVGFALITAPANRTPQALSSSTAAPVTTASPASVVAILGDSYTVGIGADTPEHGYAPQLAAGLNARLLNFGISGTGYVSPANATPFGNRVAQIVAARPSIVIAQGSVNDSVNPGFVPQIQGAATSVLQNLKAGLPGSQIVVVGPAPTPKLPASQIAPDAASVKAAADATGLRFIDTTGMLDPNDTSLWAPDGIHPSTTGYARLAAALLASYRNTAG